LIRVKLEPGSFPGLAILGVSTMNFFKIILFGGIIFLITAFYIGHLDGILLGLLGFFMIVSAIASFIAIGTFYTIGKGLDTAIDLGVKAAGHGLKIAKEKKVFQQIEDKTRSEIETYNEFHQKGPVYVRPIGQPGLEIDKKPRVINGNPRD
jgi:hypothetical protein